MQGQPLSFPQAGITTVVGVTVLPAASQKVFTYLLLCLHLGRCSFWAVPTLVCGAASGCLGQMYRTPRSVHDGLPAWYLQLRLCFVSPSVFSLCLHCHVFFGFVSCPHPCLLLILLTYFLFRRHILVLKKEDTGRRMVAWGRWTPTKYCRTQKPNPGHFWWIIITTSDAFFRFEKKRGRIEEKQPYDHPVFTPRAFYLYALLHLIVMSLHCKCTYLSHGLSCFFVPLFLYFLFVIWLPGFDPHPYLSF